MGHQMEIYDVSLSILFFTDKYYIKTILLMQGRTEFNKTFTADSWKQNAYWNYRNRI